MLCIDKKLTWSTHVYIEVRNGEEEEEVDGSQPTHPTLGLVWSGVLQGEVRKWGVADDNYLLQLLARAADVRELGVFMCCVGRRLSRVAFVVGGHLAEME